MEKPHNKITADTCTVQYGLILDDYKPTLHSKTLYQSLQRVRILVDDISLYGSSWNRALRLGSYLNSKNHQQANKRGKKSQILHLM